MLKLYLVLHRFLVIADNNIKEIGSVEMVGKYI
jgi:hypothetical protein